MGNVFNWLQFLWWVSIVAESALLFFLFQRGFARVYTFFTAYIAADICVSLGMMWFVPDPHTKAYTRVWSATEPLLLCLEIAFAVELYRLISNHYRNFDRIRPRLFWTCFLSALAVSLLVLVVDMPANWHNPLLQSVVIGKRVVTFALATFVVALTMFLRLFRIPIRPNITLHRRLATVYFLANAALYFTLILDPKTTYFADAVLMALSGGCFVAWSVFLRPAGEAVETLSEPQPSEIDAHLRRGDELARSVSSVKP